MADQVAVPPLTFGEELALDYKHWTLDCVVTIANAVAVNVIAQPERYQGVSDVTAENLTNLQAKYGFDPNFPDLAARCMLMEPYFGKSDGLGPGIDSSAFQRSRLPVLQAALDFEEHTQTFGFPALRSRFQRKIVDFKAAMTKFQDLSTKLQIASLSQTEKRTRFIFGIAQEIFHDGGVRAKFGINAAIDPNWPQELPIDSLGAQLIEQITTELRDQPCGVITREMFINMQLIAQNGLKSIRDTLDQAVEDPNFNVDKLDQLIAEFYSWGYDLPSFGGARPQRQSSPAQSTATETAPMRTALYGVPRQ
jgi:hypothetical protein